MTIPEPLLCTAILATTANGREAPNAYRIISWLYGNELINCGITSFGTSSDEFLQVTTYLEEHFNVKTKPTRETGAAYEFIPQGARTRTGRIPSPRLSHGEKNAYQQFVKGVFSHHDTEPSSR